MDHVWCLFILFLPFLQSTDTFSVKDEMLRQINDLRQTGCTCGNQRMAPATRIEWNERLEISARSHAQEMYQFNFLDHFSRDGKGVGERTRGYGYDWRVIGENVARGQHSVEELVADWKESKTHCLVMMNPKVEEMGAANVGHYWVLHVGVQKGIRN